MNDEETRAAAHRASMARRAAAELSRRSLLVGNPTAAQTVRDAWRPLLGRLIDRRFGDR